MWYINSYLINWQFPECSQTGKHPFREGLIKNKIFLFSLVLFSINISELALLCWAARGLVRQEPGSGFPGDSEFGPAAPAGPDLCLAW